MRKTLTGMTLAAPGAAWTSAASLTLRLRPTAVKAAQTASTVGRTAYLLRNFIEPLHNPSGCTASWSTPGAASDRCGRRPAGRYDFRPIMQCRPGLLPKSFSPGRHDHQHDEAGHGDPSMAMAKIRGALPALIEAAQLIVGMGGACDACDARRQCERGE